MPTHENADVRMRGFTQCATVADALAWLDGELDARVNQWPVERVALSLAAGRVLAGDVESRVDVPAFDRAMMDGFAVQAADVAGAAEANPRPLKEIGVCFPGQSFDGAVRPGEAVRIMTGAPMPRGADAVLPVEKTAPPNIDAPTTVLATSEVAGGKHLGHVGEDIRAGEVILRAGRVLRPQDVGVLSSVGVGEVEVVRRPRVALVITGNELLPAGTMPDGCRIVDANGPMLAALIARDGGGVLSPGIIADDREAIRQAMHADADVVLVSGGSSCGQEDHAPLILAADGQLAIHGVSMRPARPTGMGTLGVKNGDRHPCVSGIHDVVPLGREPVPIFHGDVGHNGRLVFLLPGNPVACLFAYDLFAGPAIRCLGGRSRDWPYRTIGAMLARPINSQAGRMDYVRVQFVGDNIGDTTNGGRVEPISRSGASVLSSTVRADGFILVPENCGKLDADEPVLVYLYDDQGE